MPKKRASSKRVARRQTAKSKTGKRVKARTRAAASKIVVTEGMVTGKLTEREREIIARRFGLKKPRQRVAVTGRVKKEAAAHSRRRDFDFMAPSPPPPGGASLPGAAADAETAALDLGGDPIPPVLSGDVIPPKG